MTPEVNPLLRSNSPNQTVALSAQCTAEKSPDQYTGSSSRIFGQSSYPSHCFATKILSGIVLILAASSDFFHTGPLNTGNHIALAGFFPEGSVGAVIIDSLLLVAGFALLVGGAELLVRGASKIALLLGISPLVVGLTVVAFGTSSPEGAVSVFSAFSDQSGIAVGNIIGSNIMNILIVIGLSTAIMPMVVSEQVIQLQVPLVIAASVAFFVMALDGTIGTLDGFILFNSIIIYTVWAIRKSRREQKKIKEAHSDNYTVPEDEEANKFRAISRHGILTLAGILVLVAAAHMLVDGASDIAAILGVSDLIIGLTIVALGTSLPELATSVVAGIKKRRDIAVGNIIGSNLFNILAVIGLSSLVAPNGIAVPESAIQFDIPVMTAVAFACLPIFFTGHRICRWEGFLFLGYYGFYLTYLILSARNDASPSLFKTVILFFVVPLTVITLAVSVYRHIKLSNLDQSKQ